MLAFFYYLIYKNTVGRNFGGIRYAWLLKGIVSKWLVASSFFLVIIAVILSTVLLNITKTSTMVSLPSLMFLCECTTPGNKKCCVTCLKQGLHKLGGETTHICVIYLGQLSNNSWANGTVIMLHMRMRMNQRTFTRCQKFLLIVLLEQAKANN